MIKEEEDASILETIRTLLSKVRYATAEDDDHTDAEVAELDESFRRSLRVSWIRILSKNRCE